MPIPYPPPPSARRTLVKCHTTAANGAPFLIEIRPDWAPLGAQRFLELVQSGYFEGVSFFRYVPGFLTQFGITPNKDLRKHWREQGPIADDPNEHRPIKRGYLSFAGAGPNTRDMQLFIALADSDWLGKAPWEVPVGRVIYGMVEVVDKIFPVGEIHPFDEHGVKQGKIWAEGNEYLHKKFPKLDYFTDCSIMGPSPEDTTKTAAKGGEAQQQGKEAAAAAGAAGGQPEGRQAAAAPAAAAAAAEKGGKEAGKAAAKPKKASSGKLAAAVEERLSSGAAAPDGGRPASALWGAGTLCFVVGSIGLFLLLLYRLGDEAAVQKGR